jgi:hypothetical protein
MHIIPPIILRLQLLRLVFIIRIIIITMADIMGVMAIQPLWFITQITIIITIIPVTLQTLLTIIIQMAIITVVIIMRIKHQQIRQKDHPQLKVHLQRLQQISQKDLHHQQNLLQRPQPVSQKGIPPQRNHLHPKQILWGHPVQVAGGGEDNRKGNANKRLPASIAFMKLKRQDISYHLVNLRSDYQVSTISFFFILIISINSKAQTTSYMQLGNEFQFVHAISPKVAAEVYFGSTFSNTPSDNRVLSTNIQRYISGWVHYYYSPRWKFSSSLAYYYNKDVPDIGQYFSPEWRWSLQGTYYIHKTGYTLLTRMRGEFRYMMNAEGVYEDKYRYRQMIKYMKPVNSKVLRKGVFYFLATEELLFKPAAKTEGVTFFDRNRFEIGGGYMLTDDLQLELTYVNEFLPRDNGNELYNVIAFTATFNNPLTNLKKRISSLASKNSEEE